MSFVRNSWYVGAFSSELAEGPLARIILEERICMFRGTSGNAFAVMDLCPHRFAPLHRGKIVGDDIQCVYHGVRLKGEDGSCSHIPHNDRAIPRAVCVRSFPVQERHGSIWLWMGDPAEADPDLIPDLSILDDERFAFEQVYVRVAGNYQLFADNLLDLSHAEFLHPYLVEEDDAGSVNLDTQVHQRRVEISYQQFDAVCPGLYRANWTDAPDRIDALSTIAWFAPSTCIGKMMARPVGADQWLPETGGVNTHAMTPETATTTHYFYNGGFPRRVATPEYRAAFREMCRAGFLSEDIGIIEDIQRNLGDRDMMSLKPAMLKGDVGAVRARQIVDRLLGEEAEIRSAPAPGRRPAVGSRRSEEAAA